MLCYIDQKRPTLDVQHSREPLLTWQEAVVALACAGLIVLGWPS